MDTLLSGHTTNSTPSRGVGLGVGVGGGVGEDNERRSGGRVKSKGDVNQSMDDFLDELDEMSSAHGSKVETSQGSKSGENDSSAAAAATAKKIPSRGYRSNSERSEVNN